MPKEFTEQDLAKLNEWRDIQYDIEEIKKIMARRKNFLESKASELLTPAAKAMIALGVKSLNLAELVLKEAVDSWE